MFVIKHFIRWNPINLVLGNNYTYFLEIPMIFFVRLVTLILKLYESIFQLDYYKIIISKKAKNIIYIDIQTIL